MVETDRANRGVANETNRKLGVVGCPRDWANGELDKMRAYLVYSGRSYRAWRRFIGAWLTRSWTAIPKHQRPKDESTINYDRPPGV